MSRIEKALEKAAQLRTRRPEDGEAGRVTPFVPADPEVFPFNPSNPCVIWPQDERAAAAEQYRKLRAALLKLTKKEFRNLIMVTSSLSGEGKSVTAINLAVATAQELNQTVLLVDADLRRPVLQRYLNLDPVFGIADCLADGIDPGRAIVKTGLPKLSFLGPGKKVANPAELLSSYRMKALLGDLKERYRDRYVIIDTPPVLPFAETHAICLMVDGVLFVVKEGTASLDNITDALESLHGAALLGLVYNDAVVGNLENRYGYYGYAYSGRPGA